MYDAATNGNTVANGANRGAIPYGSSIGTRAVSNVA
jgi:hypothetical protein